LLDLAIESAVGGLPLRFAVGQAGSLTAPGGVAFVGRFIGVAIILPLTSLGVLLLLILSDQRRRAYAARRTTE